MLCPLFSESSKFAAAGAALAAGAAAAIKAMIATAENTFSIEIVLLQRV
jgi:hypothetical protein